MTVVLDINDLIVSLGTDTRAPRIIDGVSLQVAKGETLCLVGESGSGKSVTSLTVMGLLQKGSLVPSGGSIKLVGLNPQVMDRLPHEFSGGQRQRIGLARALMLKPDVLIADEPVSALDVTVQAQVLKLLDDVRKQMNLAMLFITHDMRVAAQVCHRVMVMRHGRIVECGPTRDIFAAPSNDYTKALLAAIPGRQSI